MTNLWYIISITSSFVSAILGIAYSILTDSISDIEEKYESRTIIDVFKRKKEAFKEKLKVNVSIIFVFILARYLIGIVYKEDYVEITTLGISIILMAVTYLLILSYLKFVDDIIMFRSPLELLEFFVQKKSNLNEKDCFKAVEDIFFYSLKKKDWELNRKASEFIYESFMQKRANVDSPIEYPSYNYDFIRRVTYFCVPKKDPEYLEVENLVLGGLLLLGELKYSAISDKTFYIIWNTLRFSVQNNRDDIAFIYWRNAYQYKMFVLDQNSQVVKIEEKDLFLEFHILLGALLLERSLYPRLREIFYYSSSLPPRYVLFPESTTEIFIWLNKFHSFNRDYIFLESKYPFPDKNDARASEYIKIVVVKYLVLLLIRELSLPSYYTYDNHFSIPVLPSDEQGLYNWGNNVIPFIEETSAEILALVEEKNLVNKPISNDEFNRFILKLKSNIESAYQEIKKGQPISQEKENEFRDNTVMLIKEKLSPLLEFNKMVVKSKEFISSSYNVMLNQIVDKGAFAKDQHIAYVGLDSSFAEYIIFNLYATYSLIFSRYRKKTYLLKEDDIFTGIYNIVSETSGDFIIVACRTNLEYWISLDKRVSKKNGKFFFLDSPILDLWNCHHSLAQSFYILEKKNLPYISFDKPDQSVIDKYALNIYDEELKLFGNLIDLNKRKDLHSEIPTQENDIEEYAIVSLYLTPSYLTNKGTTVIEFKVFDRFENRGVPNKVSDVEKWQSD